MSWRSSLLAAVVVLAAGAAVGVLIGGKTSTDVRTRTVVRTVKLVRTVTTTASTSTPGTTTPSVNAANATAATGAPSNSSEHYLAEYVESVGGINVVNDNSQNASMLENPNQQELGGQVYQHAVAFGLSSEAENESADAQIPTPGFARFTAPAIGLESTANANAAYRLTIYKNNDSSPHSTILYQGSFQGPSTIRKVSFSLQGAADILLVWTHKAAEPDNQDTFVLADPVLSER